MNIILKTYFGISMDEFCPQKCLNLMPILSFFNFHFVCIFHLSGLSSGPDVYISARRQAKDDVLILFILHNTSVVGVLQPYPFYR